MAFRNRGADARLRRIENALHKLTDRLNAISRREDAGHAVTDTMPLHHKVAQLLGEVAQLHPISAVGLASKARIVIAHFELGEAGHGALSSLVADLQFRGLKQRR